MLKLKKIAITGGVASGKSSVCRFFEELGACVVNADAIVHELLKPDTDLGQQIIRILGPEILQDGKINRKVVAEKVFKDPLLLEALEKLLHPETLRKIEERYQEACQQKKYTSFVVEIPLLFEIRGESFYDVIVAVLSEEVQSRKRFEQMGFQPVEYDRRMRRQIAPAKKAARAHYTLQNNSSLEDLRRQVVALNKTLHKT